jgi:hypothetical protein
MWDKFDPIFPPKCSSHYHFFAFSFLTTTTISLLRAAHDQSNLSPSFRFHCLTIDIGMTVRNDAKLLEALLIVVTSPMIVCMSLVLVIVWF